MKTIKVKLYLDVPNDFTGIAEFANGDKYWYKEGKYHREDGPAVEWANGNKEWWFEGELHRLDGPAFEHPNGTKEWLIEAKVALRHAGAHAFAHRKDKKTDMRRLFTVRLNAGLRALGITYSVFIDKLTKNNIIINRKMLAEIAQDNPETFSRIVTHVKG
jgi:large subunit ribosomal protein L20